MSPRTVLPLAILLCSPGLATGQAIRAGEHPGFGRVVFDLPVATVPDVKTGPTGMQIALPGAGTLAPPQALPRLIASLRTGPDTAAIVLAPGARAQVTQLDRRLVIDVRAPVSREPKNVTKQPKARWDDIEATAREKAGLSQPTPGSPALPASGDPNHALPQTPPPLSQPDLLAGMRQPRPDHAHIDDEASAPDVPAPAGPIPAPAAPPATNAPVAAAPAMFSSKIAADGDVAAAAFRRGPLGIVVFDRRLGVPASSPGAEWVQGPVSTVLQVPLPPEQRLTLSHTASGWTVDAAAASTITGALEPAPDAGGTVLAMSQPGSTVAISDTLTGGLLLVGTSRSAEPKAAIAEQHRTPSFTLLPTWLGVAVEPVSDQVDLRPTSAGFILTGGSMPAVPNAGAWTRRFDIPTAAATSLLNRLHAQLASAADAPPRARTADRVGAARTMVALGMGVEAQGLLRITAAEDPQAAADADISGLTAIAALLAGRVTEADALDDPRLDGSDEISFWRGLRDRRRNQDTPAARDLGRVAGLATTFPIPLRNQVWPELAEAAVMSGNELPDNLLPPLAQAMLLERERKVGEALVAYDAVAVGPDRIAGPRAALKAVELRLASGQLGAGEAANALEQRSYDWRGSEQEGTVLLRAAELRSAARDWSRSLDTLRSVDKRFPDRHPAVLAQEAQTIQAMLEAKGGEMSALDVVLLAAEHADAVPDGPAGAAMARLLADKLMALDLPSRAIPVLQGLVATAPAGPVRAEFGARFAQLLLEGDSPADAITALQASAAGDLPAALDESRTLLLARAKAAEGDVAGGTALLGTLGTDAADELRATLLERSGDLRGSLAALDDLAARHPLPDGPLPDPTQDALLRQASLAARIQDRATLHRLASAAPRFTGPRADLFRTLTSDPIGTTRDLTRAGRELALARGVPERLQAWQGR